MHTGIGEPERPREGIISVEPDANGSDDEGIHYAWQPHLGMVYTTPALNWQVSPQCCGHILPTNTAISMEMFCARDTYDLLPMQKMTANLAAGLMRLVAVCPVWASRQSVLSALAATLCIMSALRGALTLGKTYP